MSLRNLILLSTMAVYASAQAPQQDLGATMQSIAQALGVNCDYCHSASRGSGQPEPKKDIARQMMAMTREANAKIQTATQNTSAKLECVTCHRGVAIPRQISDIVMDTIRQKGTPAAITQYRDLREHFYGRQAYDFGEDTLLSLGQRISAARPDEAILLLELNLEYYPNSARSFAAIGYAYTRKYDDESAIKNYEKALEIEPKNGVIQGQLEQLKTFRRRK